jgi:sarcosine oxidase
VAAKTAEERLNFFPLRSSRSLRLIIFMSTFDTIVLGMGGMGSATLCQLAKRGLRVLGIEQFPLVHSRGSSHGHTRIIRTAYYEHPSYVPLVRRSFELWRDLERETNQELLVPSPCVTMGPLDGELVQGVMQAAREHSLSVESLSNHELMNQFPAFRIGDECTGVLEHDAGMLFVEECVRAQLDVAKQNAAEIKAECPVLDWTANDHGVTVRTKDQTFHAAKLVITAGAWATTLLRDIGVPFAVMRQTMHWFEPSNRQEFGVGRFPIFLLDTPEGAFYGMPALESRGVKVARHYGAPELAGPSDVNWEVTESDAVPVIAFLNQHIPSAIGPSTGQVCMYTLTPDRHFVIDVHPNHSNVFVAAGFSGHGFKFAPVVGEVLADLVERGSTRQDISLFRATRFTSPKGP